MRFHPKNPTNSRPHSGAWPDIHISPAQGVRAHLDLQGGRPHGVLLPIRWGTFHLAFHAWVEPGEWTRDAAEKVGQAVASPQPGEPFEPARRLPADPWWRAVSGPIVHPWRRPESVVTAVADKRSEDLDFAGDV